MFRSSTARLTTWLGSPARRPLGLRGTRQVGKTWLVRELAAQSGRDLVEVNFEREPRLARHFEPKDPRAVLDNLSLALGRTIAADRSLLFLDEIQAAPSILASLRWFAEELPELPVVAAGSLLELALADHAWSAPVGRIGFRHVEPMGFTEFLLAHGQTRLFDVLDAWVPGVALANAAHDAATRWFERYSMVGGMPAVVAEDVARGDARACRALQKDLVATFRADFPRYAGRMDRRILDGVLDAVARSLGGKFVYARVGEGIKDQQARAALELLAQARVIHLVTHTAANGVPLGGETKDRVRKAVLADVGMLHALLETPAGSSHPAWSALAPQVRGQLVEQLAAQQIRLLDDGVGDGARLFYWHREGGRPGEIDHVIQAGGTVVPIELKAGVAGSMKSLHQFMADKALGVAVRLDADPPSLQTVSVTTTRGARVTFRLLALPHYLGWAIRRALERLPAA